MRKILASVLAFLVATPIASAEEALYRWDMPTAYKGYHTENAALFADCVRQATDGGIDITVRGGGEMLRGGQIFPALKSGDVVIGERLLSAHGHEHKIFNIDSIPFLATSYEASERLAITAEPVIRAKLEAYNLHLLYSVPWPAQGLFFKKKIDAISDMADVKFRVYNDRTWRLSKLTGMKPTHVDIESISHGVAIGVWEGLVTSSKTVAERKLWEVGISHHYTVDAWFPRNSVMINLDMWRGLRDEEREALTRCGEVAAERGLRLSKEQNETPLAKLREGGMIVAEPSDDLMAELIEKVGEPMIAEWLETADESSAAAIASFRDTATSE